MIEHSQIVSVKALFVYDQIIEISVSGPKIPFLSMEDASEILRSMRPDVLDYYSCSPRHLLKLNLLGIQVFRELLNLLISNINLTSLPEVNTAWSIVIYKGHSKQEILQDHIAAYQRAPY